MSITNSKTNLFWIVLWGVLSLNLRMVYPQTTYVPLNHWVYEYLDRLETRHVVRGFLNTTRPLSRLEIAKYLVQVHQNTDPLNKVEQDQLNFLNIEFTEELAEFIKHSTPYQTRIHRIRNNKLVRRILPKIIYQNDRNFLSWHQYQFHVYFDPILFHQRSYINTDSLEYTEKIFQRASGIHLRGNIGDHLGFLLDARDTIEWGTRDYRLGNYTLPRLGFVRATSPDYIYHDETVAYLKFGLNHIHLTYGKFSNFWGSGYTGSLILSDYATSYDQFKLEIIFAKFKFTSLYAYLIDYADYERDVLQKKKYLAAHRLEFAPWRWLLLGLSESVIFKGRSFEPAYLNPIMFFRSAEHYLGSPDNVMMGLDFKCTVLKNIKFYGELLIDDITTTKLGTDWYGNKLGYTAGTYWTDPLKLQNTDIRIEYTRIRPFVYSHENALSYTHYDSFLGHRIGPNSDELYIELNYRFSKYTKLTVFSEFLRHGTNTADKNFGGDVDRPHISGDNLHVKFLAGDVEKINSIGIQFSYEIWRNFYFRIGYLKEHEKNIFFSNQRDNIINNDFTISFGLNY